jgi:hypothetical protein
MYLLFTQEFSKHVGRREKTICNCTCSWVFIFIFLFLGDLSYLNHTVFVLLKNAFLTHEILFNK